MLSHKKLEKYILGKPGSWLDYPFGEEVAVYKVGSRDEVEGQRQGKMFALIQEGKHPIQISLKCDPVLAEKLRKQYESIMPGYHLNKKHWNTILVTGQLEKDDLLGLIDLSYQLVLASLTKEEQAIVGKK